MKLDTLLYLLYYELLVLPTWYLCNFSKYLEYYFGIYNYQLVAMYGLMYTKHDHLYTCVASKDLDLLLQFKASGVICQLATNECDITEYCTGTSGEVCVCMYVYVNVYVYVYVVCICMCMCMCTCMHICVYGHLLCTCVCMCVHVYVCVSLQVCMCCLCIMCACAHVYICQECDMYCFVMHSVQLIDFDRMVQTVTMDR